MKHKSRSLAICSRCSFSIHENKWLPEAVRLQKYSFLKPHNRPAWDRHCNLSHYTLIIIQRDSNILRMSLTVYRIKIFGWTVPCVSLSAFFFITNGISQMQFISKMKLQCIYQCARRCTQKHQKTLDSQVISHKQCWGKLLLKVIHCDIALFPKKVTDYITWLLFMENNALRYFCSTF